MTISGAELNQEDFAKLLEDRRNLIKDMYTDIKPDDIARDIMVALIYQGKEADYAANIAYTVGLSAYIKARDEYWQGVMETGSLTPLLVSSVVSI